MGRVIETGKREIEPEKRMLKIDRSDRNRKEGEKNSEEIDRDKVESGGK